MFSEELRGELGKSDLDKIKDELKGQCYRVRDPGKIINEESLQILHCSLLQ